MKRTRYVMDRHKDRTMNRHTTMIKTMSSLKMDGRGMAVGAQHNKANIRRIMKIRGDLYSHPCRKINFEIIMIIIMIIIIIRNELLLLLYCCLTSTVNI